jgi:hypothetical protein
MRQIALNIGNDLAVQVDLMQVTRAVKERIQHAAIRQRGLHAIAQLVICVTQQRRCAGRFRRFRDQLAQRVITQADGGVGVDGASAAPARPAHSYRDRRGLVNPRAA